MSLRVAVMACVLVAPLAADEEDTVKFFGVEGQKSPATQPDGAAMLGRTDFANLEEALNSLPEKWWVGTTSGEEWDKMVGERLVGKSITYSGVFGVRLLMSAAQETRVIFPGRLSPERGGLLYEVVVHLPRDSPDPILKLPAKQEVILQGKIVSAGFIKYSEQSEPRFSLKLDDVTHVRIAQTAPVAALPDSPALAAENARLKAEVERLTAVCRGFGIDPESRPLDLTRPTYGSVEEALKAMPRKFFDPSQDVQLRRGYVQGAFVTKFVRVRGTVSVQSGPLRTFGLDETPTIRVIIAYDRRHALPRAGDIVDEVIRLKHVDVRGTSVIVYGDVLRPDKP